MLATIGMPKSSMEIINKRQMVDITSSTMVNTISHDHS